MKEWEESEDFKYDKFQAFWDFEFNHSQGNYKLANEQSFTEAWNHQQNKIEKLQKHNDQLIKWRNKKVDRLIAELKQKDERLAAAEKVMGMLVNVASDGYLAKRAREYRSKYCGK